MPRDGDLVVAAGDGYMLAGIAPAGKVRANDEAT